jgi:hypothetical protein
MWAEVVAERSRLNRVGSGGPVTRPSYLDDLDAATPHAGATAAMVEVHVVGERRLWIAGAIGDSTVFQVRGSDVVASFPFLEVDEMPLRPRALWSDPTWARTEIETHWRSCSHDAEVGDHLLLATDEVARRLLTDPERDWRTITDLRPDTFPQWVHETRHDGAGQDDMTLVILAL